MLIRADPQQDTLSLFSFPRDLVVPIYCNKTSAYATDRINTAWTDCGSRGTLDTVQKLIASSTVPPELTTCRTDPSMSVRYQSVVPLAPTFA